MQHTSTPLVGTDPASRVKLLEALAEYSQIVSVASAAARNALAATVTPTAAPATRRASRSSPTMPKRWSAASWPRMRR